MSDDNKVANIDQRTAGASLGRSSRIKDVDLQPGDIPALEAMSARGRALCRGDKPRFFESRPSDAPLSRVRARPDL
jgi:hypothetical protein